MSWEIYERQHRKGEGDVTISSSFISFFVETINKFNITNRFAELYYDSESNKIGIMFVPEQNQHTVRCFSHKSYGVVLYAKGFLKDFNLLPKKTQRYYIKQDINTKMLIIELKKD